ncbi:unnamed protein product [Closterium sp. NIES-53]
MRAVPAEQLERVKARMDQVTSFLKTQDPTAQDLTISSLNPHFRDDPNHSLFLFLTLAPCYCPGLYASLSSLTLHRLSPIPSHSLSSLCLLPSLISLSFLETSINRQGEFHFSSLSQLHRLVLDCPDPSEVDFDLDPEDFYYGKPMEKLRELHISRVTDCLLLEFATLTGLEAISFTCSEEVTQWGLRSLNRLTRLARLQAAPENLEDHHLQLQFRNDSLPMISRVCKKPTPDNKRARVSSMQLGNPEYPCVDGSVWQVVGALHGLEQLGVHGVARSEQDLQAITALTGLTSLHITGTNFKDIGCIRSFSQLRDLGLAGCSVCGFTCGGLELQHAISTISGPLSHAGQLRWRI